MTPVRSVRIGTRGSALAQVQATTVRSALEARGIAAELVVIETEGDRRAPDTAWGEGAFVGAIEDALLDGRVDVAVHSAKDVPTDEDPRLLIAAFLQRQDPRDVVVVPPGRRASSLEDLAPGLRVGTDSPRRTAFLRAARPDLRPHPLHGNVDTRLRRLDSGATDALLLAAAGLHRLGRSDRIAFALPADVVPPAPGQGALAVQVRADDRWTRGAVERLDDASTRRAVAAERALLAAAGGGCRAPIGATARELPDGALELAAGYARHDGTVRTVARRTAVPGASSDPDLVTAVLRDIVAAASRQADARGERRVVVTRAASQSAALALALVDRGLAPVAVPAIAIEPAGEEGLDDAVISIGQVDWVVVTSANAIQPLVAAAERIRLDPADLRRPRWAAVGHATARALRAAGIPVAVEGTGGSGEDLVAQLPLAHGARVLLPRGDRADARVPARLRARGASVREVIAYRTVVAPLGGEAPLRQSLVRNPAAVVFTSASTVVGLVELAARIDAQAAVRAIPAICVGRPTEAAARGEGFQVAAIAASPSAGDVAAAAGAAVGADPGVAPSTPDLLVESR